MLTNCGVGEDFWESLGQQEAFPVAQRLKRLSAMRETWVGSLDQEDPLEKEMATHSSILAWRIPWTEEPGGLWSNTPGFPVITNSQNLLKFMSIDWMIPSNQLSVVPFSSCLQSFPASGSFLMSWLFPSSIGASDSVSVLPMNIQG